MTTHLRLRFLLLLWLCAGSACVTVQPVVYKDFNNVRSKVESGAPRIDLEVVFYNPNKSGVRLTDGSCILLVGRDTVGRAVLDTTVRVNARSEFSVPVTFHTTFPRLIKLVPGSLDVLFGNRPLDATLRGNFTIKKFFFRRTYPLDLQQKIDSRILKDLF